MILIRVQYKQFDANERRYIEFTMQNSDADKICDELSFASQLNTQYLVFKKRDGGIVVVPINNIASIESYPLNENKEPTK